MPARLLSLGTVLVGLALAAPAWAQNAYGVRVGGTIDPDQAHFGVHLRMPDFSPRVRFQPSLEVGFGDNRVIGAANLDLLYGFDPGSVRPYAGGGLGLALVHDDRGPLRDADVRFEAGLNLVGGIEWGPAYRYLLELRVGVGDLPDIKATFGITF